LLAGCSAGIIHGLVNSVLVEPYLDKAIGIENQHLFESGDAKDTPQFWVEYYSYRAWQKGGQLLAGAILGIAIGALYGIVFGYARNILPGNHFVKKTLILAAIMWVTLYLIPFAKYPANPPTVGDPETIILRQTLYVLIIGISGVGALGFYQVYKRLKNKKIIAVLGYSGFITAVFFAMPQNPDVITAPMDLVNGFRMVSLVGTSIFWLSLGFIFGILWQKLQPERVRQSTFQ
jgi:hypothetical protein